MSDSPHPRWHARVPAAAVQACSGPMDRAVLLTLGLYADTTGTVLIGHGQIAREIGVSTSAVKRALRRLRHSRAVTMTPGTGRAVSTYRLSTGTRSGVSSEPPGGSESERSGVTADPLHIRTFTAGAQGALPAECEHGDPYGGRRCIDCRQEATA